MRNSPNRDVVPKGAPARWEHFAHGADIGVRGVGQTLEAAFEQAALALTGIVTAPDTLSMGQVIEMTCEAPDTELLLVDWLNAVIYEMATRRLVFGKYEVRIEGNSLRARAWGQPMAPEVQELGVEPKGATYTALSVHQTDDSYAAECVVDV